MTAAELLNEHLPRVVFFDADKAGHIPSHVTAIGEALLKGKYAFRPVFCLNPDIVGRLSKTVTDALKDGLIEFRPLSPQDIDDSLVDGALSRGMSRWKMAQRLASEQGAAHIFFFVLDGIMSGAIADSLRLRRLVPFSGILFRPRLHLRPQGTEGLPEAIKRRRQYPYYAAALTLSSMRTIWTLDPFFPEFARKYLPNGDKTHFIAEQNILEGGVYEAVERDAAAPIRFLMFGLLKERKGVLVLLKALLTFSSADWAKMEITLLGEFDRDIRDEGLRLVEQVRNEPGSRLNVVDEYVPTAQIKKEVARSDVLLANYLNHIGSSGVGFTAAIAGKPIITQATGLLGHLTRRYDLGVTVDTRDPLALAASMRALANNLLQATLPESLARREYVALNSTPFTEVILHQLEAFAAE